MEDETIILAKSLRQVIALNYESGRIKKKIEANSQLSAILENRGYDNLFDPKLHGYFLKNQIFFKPFEQVIKSRGIVTAYLGDIITRFDSPKRGYVCTRSGRFKGIDFYDGEKGKNPTLVKQINDAVLIDKDNVAKAAKAGESIDLDGDAYSISIKSQRRKQDEVIASIISYLR